MHFLQHQAVPLRSPTTTPQARPCSDWIGHSKKLLLLLPLPCLGIKTSPDTGNVQGIPLWHKPWGSTTRHSCDGNTGRGLGTLFWFFLLPVLSNLWLRSALDKIEQPTLAFPHWQPPVELPRGSCDSERTTPRYQHGRSLRARGQRLLYPSPAP